MGLKTLVECCLVLEEGVASAKDIEMGMMMGAGILPGPFTRADEAGLDTLLEQLERAQGEWGEAFEPPVLLRRLVAQGRLGKKTGQGFFPYPQPDAGDQRETVLLETRGDVAIAWLNRPPTNPLSPQAVRDFISVWEQVEGSAMACDFRIAAESATFGQPEINLGIIPGFGGTQRLPRLVGEGKALEMNLTGDPIDAYEAHRVGLAHQVVPDHELFDAALAWARKLAGQAPIAVEEIKKGSHHPDLDDGLAAEGEGFARAFGSEDAKEGIGAFLGKRKPSFKGR